MLEFGILFPAVLNGLTTGAVYALVALGLTLIYGVLHIINFAHGAALMLALYAVYLLKENLGVDPYLALVVVVPGMFALGYA
ncbi:MAG TPA: branched-chain amino acid ABC transporter permease, partial [Ramlibacter sp.]|nr:branched-chain amino acid ABC transporter permease [Ramlibacter sp.]